MVSCVSSYFANDVNHIVTTILISFIAIVFLCAFLLVFPRCKWGSEKSVAVWIFAVGLIGTGFGGFEGHQLAKTNDAICGLIGLIGPGNVDAICGLIGGLIGAAIGKGKAAEASEEKEGKDSQTEANSNGNQLTSAPQKN